MSNEKGDKQQQKLAFQEEEKKEPKIAQQTGTKAFAQIGVAPWLIQNLREVGIETPTEIQ